MSRCLLVGIIYCGHYWGRYWCHSWDAMFRRALVVLVPCSDSYDSSSIRCRPVWLNRFLLLASPACQDTDLPRSGFVSINMLELVGLNIVEVVCDEQHRWRRKRQAPSDDNWASSIPHYSTGSVFFVSFRLIYHIAKACNACTPCPRLSVCPICPVCR